MFLVIGIREDKGFAVAFCPTGSGENPTASIQELLRLDSSSAFDCARFSPESFRRGDLTFGLLGRKSFERALRRSLESDADKLRGNLGAPSWIHFSRSASSSDEAFDGSMA